jgi:hypothetical protein
MIKDKEDKFLILLPFLFIIFMSIFIYNTGFSDSAKERQKINKEERDFCHQFRDAPEKDTPVRCIGYLKYND